jgi:hypothetical protein
MCLFSGKHYNCLFHVWVNAVAILACLPSNGRKIVDNELQGMLLEVITE